MTSSATSGSLTAVTVPGRLCQARVKPLQLIQGVEGSLEVGPDRLQTLRVHRTPLSARDPTRLRVRKGACIGRRPLRRPPTHRKR